MIFGLVSNQDKDVGFAFAKRAAAIIRDHGSEAIVNPTYIGTPLGDDPNVRIATYDACDLLFSIGGDGTFLTAVHQHFVRDIPIIGVNLGSIGFLTEIQPDQFEDALMHILNGDYSIENRIQLHVRVTNASGEEKATGLCLNDVVIARGYLLHLLTVDFFVDGAYVERLSGDGVIISTPTGSTAYSLAAGGPIIMPELDVFIVTPICPHTLHNRSYVVSEKSIVEIRMKDFHDQPILSLDGRNDIQIDRNDRIFVTRSESPIQIARIGYSNFYQTIRKKIRARGSFYEDDQE